MRIKRMDGCRDRQPVVPNGIMFQAGKTGHSSLLDEVVDRMGTNVDEWLERKPGFFRSPNGKMEIEISEGHPHMGEGPHVKVMVFDPTKGKKGGMRVVEKIFVEEAR